MNKKLTFAGGEPNVTFDDIMRQQYGNTAAIDGLVKDLGLGITNFVISGVEVGTVSGGVVPISAGWVMIGGEVVQVDAQEVPELTAGNKYKVEKVTTYEAGGNKTFVDGTPRQTWQKNRGVVSIVTEATAVDLDLHPRSYLKNRLRMPATFVATGTWDMDNNDTKNIITGIPAILQGYTGSQILDLICNCWYQLHPSTFTTIRRALDDYEGNGSVSKSIREVYVDNDLNPSQITFVLTRNTGGTYNQAAYNNVNVRLYFQVFFA